MTPRELVQQKHPDAFLDDDGDWVYIRLKRTVTEQCPHCKQSWTHKATDYTSVLGSGGSGLSAWKSAAENLGLIKNHPKFPSA